VTEIAVEHAAQGGAIYGLYTSMAYMACLPGGWVADRLIGQRKAVLYGGILIASGHFSMAVPSLPTFYLGLFLIVIGTGLLKGNVSVIVGQLYSAEDQRRDAGFSIFYMGINLGAFIAPHLRLFGQQSTGISFARQGSRRSGRPARRAAAPGRCGSPASRSAGRRGLRRQPDGGRSSPAHRHDRRIRNAADYGPRRS
jgi:MFS family permease